MAYLTLEDGTIYRGEGFGAKKDVIGEVVFNTGMTGYQEVLTDPSYCGQIVTMTYPMIGNYGINSIDEESKRPQVKGFVVREACDLPSNWRCETTLSDYLLKNDICCLVGIDTRALTRKIREAGTMRGIITQNPPTAMQIEEMKKSVVVKPVDVVTCDEIYHIEGKGRKVAVMDFGLKQNILRSLSKRDCDLTVFPAHTDAKQILEGGFDGVMLTNGPGDPQDNVEIIKNVKKLIGNIPIFGICLGHQLLALASGATTLKLKFGHRGANHPVKDIEKGRAYITSQNHGYTVDPESLPKNAKVSHVSLNDDSIEGIKYTNMPVFSVQFHPEASPGPEDTAYLFDEFMKLMDDFKKENSK